MRVLDLGCGPGDVSLLAASLVGSSGSVHGIDKSQESVALARERATPAGLPNLSFEVGDLDSFRLTHPVDAVIGRLVLMYLPDPVTTLQRLLGRLPPGTIVAFQEIDVTVNAFRSVPECPLYVTCGERIWETFRRAGLETEMGSRPYSSFLRAGLVNLNLLLGAAPGAGPDSPIYEHLALTVRSLLPMMERFGVASRAEIEIDSLAERLRGEALELEAVLILPSLMDAWARKPPCGGN